MANTSSGSPTRPSLLLRIREPRDTESWTTFVAVYGPLIYRHCLRRGLQHADAEDVTQQVFAQVHRSIRQFEYKPAQGRFRDWLGVVTRHKIARFLKKQAGEVQAAGEADEWSALETVPAPEQETPWMEECNRHILETALANIRPHFEELTWRAFELVWHDNRSPAEVAQELGRPIDWVYVAKSRVLERLHEEVEELAEGSDLFSS